MRTAVACLLCYALVSYGVFGSLAQPIALMTMWSARLGLPGWRVIVVASFLAAGFVHLLPRRVIGGVSLRPPLFILLAMAMSIGTVGSWAELARRREIARFQPDVVFQNSILSSFRKAPEEFQLFLHAGAMKDCQPFAWSYRSMSMYLLPEDAAHNVLPRAWLEQCGGRLRY